MRRGFFMAGVDNLLMTFWHIRDKETASLMANFYQAVSQTGHPGSALQRVQRDALLKLKDEDGLHKAVFLAGPFALSMTGKLPSL